jgi:hypothetical protein
MKRFRDTELWRKPWYRDNPRTARLWDYIVDHCDAAGVWHVDWGGASFGTGYLDPPLSVDDLAPLGDRVEIQEGGELLWVRGYIQFQMLKPGATELSESTYHKHVAHLLRKHGLYRRWHELVGATEPGKGGNRPGKGGNKVGTGKKDTRPSTRFVKPAPEEVSAYSAEIGYPMNGEAWCDAYEQKGWTVGKNKMKDWKAAVRNWKRNGWRPDGGGGGGSAPARSKESNDAVLRDLRGDG